MATKRVITRDDEGAYVSLSIEDVLEEATGEISSATNALKSLTTTVTVNTATAPSAGQVLTAVNNSSATWQTPAAGGIGDVVGPASAVIGNVAIFNATTGKLLADSGVALGTAAASAIGDFATTSHSHAGIYAPVLGLDDNYVTDAEKVVIGNTSGANTGDQTAVSGNSGTTTAALGLKTATTTVAVSAATAPSAGQVLTAIDGSSANWATPSGGGSVATDTIWDAAGDLAVGSGANTAAKLTIGTALQVLRTNAAANALEWATPSGGGSSEAYILIRDEKTAGSAGGGFTTGDWRTRDLNTEVVDTGNNAVLGTPTANIITLQPGTYRFRARAPGHEVEFHSCRLYNVTDLAEVAVGSNASAYTPKVQVDSEVSGRFTIATAKDFRLEHRCTATRTINGFGYDKSIAGVTEIFASIEFWKEL